MIGMSKFLSLAQGLCRYSPDPFPSQRVGSGDETMGADFTAKRDACYAVDLYQ